MEDMNFNLFQEKVLSFMNPKSLETDEAMITNAALGIVGEGGEVADLIKKWCFHEHDLDKEKVAKELGDVLFYVALGAAGIGKDLQEIAQMNVNKLLKRYPNGFTVEDSKAKKDEENRNTKTNT